MVTHVDPKTAQVRPLRGPKVLVIEDNETFRDIIAGRLQEEGYRVVAVDRHSLLYGESMRSYDVIVSDAETDNAAVFDSDGERFLSKHRAEFGRRTIAISSNEEANKGMLNASPDFRRKARCAVLKPQFSTDLEQNAKFLDALAQTVKEVIAARGRDEERCA